MDQLVHFLANQEYVFSKGRKYLRPPGAACRCQPGGEASPFLEGLSAPPRRSWVMKWSKLSGEDLLSSEKAQNRVNKRGPKKKTAISENCAPAHAPCSAIYALDLCHQVLSPHCA